MPHTRLYSAALYGVDALEVEVEVNSSRGDPKFVTVGLPDTAVKESTDRVLTALDNSGFRWSHGHVTVNLAPADLRKEGPSFDLPIALGVVALEGSPDRDALKRCAIVGELALDGRVRPVKGILPLTLRAREQGRKAILVPEENAVEAALVKGIYVYGVPDLRAAVDLLRGEGNLKPERLDRDAVFRSRRRYPFDFSEVRGQAHAKRALEVAAAGNHNLLMIGPPGTGKSMLAKRLVTLMPALGEQEAIEATKIHSVAGTLESRQGLMATRPFRSPHHTISDAGLLGGTSHPTPGEVSLAHHGILFLDELPEFRRSTLEVLRQPLEDGEVTVSRAAGKYTFPSRFMLVAAMNPCKCGYLGDPKRECRCSPKDVEKYRQRISGPLLDRIDLHIEVPRVPYEELSAARHSENGSEDAGGKGAADADASSPDPSVETSATIRQRVEDCRELQAQRFVDEPDVHANADMGPRLVREHCPLGREADTLLERAMKELDLSARAHDRILKVARTIADLEGVPELSPRHLMEAIQYRTLDRNLWV